MIYVTIIVDTAERRDDMAQKAQLKTIAQNKKAYHDYFVDEKYEAGIALFGTEVKSVRGGAVNLKDSYCSIKNGELFRLAASWFKCTYSSRTFL